MAESHPEDLGRELARTVDRNALVSEAGGESAAEMLPEIITAFAVQFGENLNHIQNELVETAFMDDIHCRHTSPTTMTKSAMRATARSYAQDALHEYANTLLPEGETVAYRDLPAPSDEEGEEDDLYAFRDAIIDGYWDDTATDVITRYASA